MLNGTDVFTNVRSAAGRKILYLPHAVRQMLRPERMITTDEVRHAIAEGILIEDYPEDPRGHSCLILGRGDDNRPIHLVCAPKQDYLAIITAYIPDPGEWSEDFRVRTKK
jgi:hypothetical protein